MSVLIEDLSKDLGELELYGYDLAPDVKGKHRRFSVFCKDDSHKGVETEIKIYPKSKDIQRIEAANMRIPIKTPEDALILAQILDLRIDFMSQHIHDKNTIKMLSEALEKANNSNIQYRHWYSQYPKSSRSLLRYRKKNPLCWYITDRLELISFPFSFSLWYYHGFPYSLILDMFTH